MHEVLRKLRTRLSDNTNHPEGSPQEHLEAAAQWLLAAQGATDDDGLAHSYDVVRQAWKASYPETTGYAIETLYRYSAICGDERYRNAARRASDWEIAVQLPGGGVMAGAIDAREVVPTIFNTGQVLFGWAAAAENEVDGDLYRDALRRAADWLCDSMDADGAWRKYSSPFGPSKESAYNTRTAYGLSRAAAVLNEERYLESAVRNVDYVVETALENGFLPQNCLQDESRPLIHTIAYSIRGILEVGVAAGIERHVHHALKMAEFVAKAQRSDGSIPGRLDSEWQSVVDWVCVTGVSQMASIWFRLAEYGVSDEFTGHGSKANRYVMRTQNRSSDDLGVRGGIKGSHPISGEYMSYRYPNWATKFFMDSLMFEMSSRKVTPNIG